MNETASSGRKTYLDLLRIISAFAVVLTHVIGKTFYPLEPASALWFRLNLLESGIRWCVPVFVMISGSLFLDPQKDIPTRKIWNQYIRRIAIAALFWSSIYALMNTLKYPTDLDLLHRCADFAITVLLKPADHLWYVYMIIGLYIMTPVIRKIISGSDRKELEYWLAAMFVLGMGPGLLRTIPTVEKYIGQAIDNAHLDFLCGFVFYYVAGYYFTKFRSKREWPWYLAALLGYCFTAAFTWISSRAAGTTLTVFDPLYPNTAVIALGIFVFFTQRVSRIRFSDTACRRLHQISNAAFGVYLSHVCVIELLGLDQVSGIVHALGNALLTFALSFAGIMVLRKINFFRKYLS